MTFLAAHTSPKKVLTTYLDSWHNAFGRGCMNPLETYLKELSQIRSSGAAVKETSYYGPLASLFNEIDKTLKPKVRCIINPQSQGAGMPDGGFFYSGPISEIYVRHAPGP